MRKKKYAVCILVVLPAVFALLWRITRGFDWSDEAYYSALVYRVIQGDALFQTSWDIHQLSAVLLVPIYWIYIKAFGTKGIILFSRVVFVFILSGEAAGLFIKYNKKCGLPASVLASLLLLSYESLYGLSYNTMTVEAFVLAFLLLPCRYTTKYRWTRYAISGFFSGIAVQSYPSTVIIIPLFYIFSLIEEKRSFKGALYYTLGGFVVIILFCFFLSINSSFDSLIKNIKYLFMDPEHVGNNFQIWMHFSEIKKQISEQTIPVLILAICFANSASLTNDVAGKGLHLCVLGCILFVEFFQWNSIKEGYGYSFIHYRLYFSISLCFILLWVIKRCSWDNFILLFFGGVIGSIGINISTNNDSSIYIFPYIVSAIATVLYVGKISQEELRKTETLYDKVYHAAHKVFFLPALFLVVYTFISSLVFVYRDGKLELLNTKMTLGPAAGIYTTELRAAQYEETISAIDTYMPKEGNVLYTKLLPFGYMLSDAKPANPRLWRTNLDYPLFEEYFTNNPEKKPDAIYIVNENYGITNNNVVIGDYIQKYITSNPHETIKLECGEIIRIWKE